MEHNNIKQRLQELVKETLQGITPGEPEVKVTHAHDRLSDDEKLIHEIMEEDLSTTFHIETTLRFVEPIEYITISLNYNE